MKLKYIALLIPLISACNDEKQPETKQPKAAPVYKIIGEISTNLPENILLNVPTPLSFTFENKGTVATNISFTKNYPADYKEVSTDCGPTLAPATTCRVIGEVLPTNPGSISVSLGLNYKEGPSVTLSTTTNATEIPVLGEIKKGLPTNIGIGKVEPISLNFTNESPHFSATGIALSFQPTGVFTNVISNCGKILTPGASCSVQGNIKFEQSGEHAFSTTMSYVEGNDIVLNTHSNVTNISLAGSVTDWLPPTTQKNVSYPVVFSYTNENTFLNANDISVIAPSNKEFKLTSNTCKSTLDAGTTCRIEGEFISSTFGGVKLETHLSYPDGATVSLSTETHVTPTNAYSVTLSNTDKVRIFSSLNLNVDSNALGDRGSVGFFIFKKLQTPEVKTFFDNVIWSGASSTNVNIEMNGHLVTLNFISIRPRCGPSLSALNACYGCAGGPERAIDVSVNQASFNALPAGSYTGIIRLSSRYYIGEFFNMVDITININKS